MKDIHIYATNFGAETRLMVDGQSRYDSDKAAPLYANEHLRTYGISVRDGLPVNASGEVYLPANVAVAVVNKGCKYCHSFMHHTEYPRELPDGRPIVYINSKDERAREFLQAQGYQGAGKDVASVVFQPPPQLHAKDIELADGETIPRQSFPIMLYTDEAGKLAGGLSSGVTGCTNLFAKLQGKAIVPVPTKMLDMEEPATDVAKVLTALAIAKALEGELSYGKQGKLVYSFGDRPSRVDAVSVVRVFSTLGVPEEQISVHSMDRMKSWTVEIPAAYAKPLVEAAGLEVGHTWSRSVA